MDKRFSHLITLHLNLLVALLCVVALSGVVFVGMAYAEAAGLPPSAIGPVGALLGSQPPPPTPEAATERIGVAAAVRGTVEAALPGQPARKLKSGDSLFHGDKITTGAESRMQILLLDETTVTVAQNSTIVMDEFLYDSRTDAGQVGASVAKGVFRFVTGKIARKTPKNIKVKLPVGTIGIRGTIFAVRTEGMESQVILLGPGVDTITGERAGAVVVETEGGFTSLTRGGFGTEVSANALEAPSSAEAVPASELQAINAELEGSAAEMAQENAEEGEATQAEHAAESHDHGHADDQDSQESEESHAEQTAMDSQTVDEALAEENMDPSAIAEAVDHGSAQDSISSGDFGEHWMAESISDAMAHDFYDVAAAASSFGYTADMSAELSDTSNDTSHDVKSSDSSSASQHDSHY